MTLPTRLFCHTSCVDACLDPGATNHARAAAIVGEVAAAGSRLCTTWDVVSETVTLLRYRRTFRSALTFLTEVKPRLDSVAGGDLVRDEAGQVFRQHGPDHRLSFCDAVSFVVLTTLLDHGPCLAYDEGFRSLGLTIIG